MPGNVPPPPRPPAPAWALKAALADAGRDLLLADQDVSAQKLLFNGFTFRDGTVEAALSQI